MAARLSDTGRKPRKQTGRSAVCHRLVIEDDEDCTRRVSLSRSVAIWHGDRRFHGDGPVRERVKQKDRRAQIATGSRRDRLQRREGLLTYEKGVSGDLPSGR